MTVLAEALADPGLSPAHAAVARWLLGQSHLTRAIEPMTPAAARGGFHGAGFSTAQADADEAIRLFGEIIDGPPISAEVISLARTMLAVAESVRPLLSGDLTRFDAGTLMRALAGLHQVQQNGWSFWTGSGLPSPMSPDEVLSQVSPLDYPVVDLRGEPGQAPAVPPRRTATAPQSTPRSQPPADPGRPRRVARDLLAALVGDSGAPVWEQARTLLTGGPERLVVGDVDAFVGAAANAVGAAAAREETGEDGDPVEAGLDRLLSAVGLCLRERRDGSGWAGDPIGGGSRAAAEQLLGAMMRIPAAHPAAAVVVEAVGGLLDEERPLSGAAITVLAAPLGEYAASVTPPRPAVTALGEVCRTAAALAAGADLEPGRLATAVAALPVDHAWHRVLATAAGQARLAAAVRAGAPVAVGAAPDGLAPLLEALLRNDLDSLRLAVGALTATAPSPRLAAVLGAAHLELAIRAVAPERNDLGAAIGLLAGAAGVLDDGSLRTRTWWRLGEAYRRRGAAGDVESSREAGLAALRGGQLDRPSAARFAGWLLADGRAAEAYSALEVAAAAAGRPEPTAGPLAEDVLEVILGIGPRAAPQPAVPAWTAVAAAVRQAGASALLYLHPTDDAGRTAGVLCLDPGAQRLEVLANVPVTDPLTSDDPGWSAILGRWSGGRLLVAATGGLRGVALSAVVTGEGRRLAQDVSVGYVSSGAQVIDLAGRASVPVGTAPLFVVNPRGDRDSEMADVMVLRRLFYPRSVYLGRGLESVDGAGTRADVCGRLPGASLVHLGCGLRGTELDLAGDEVLDVTAVRGAGLAVLTGSSTEGLGPTADAFLGVGFSGVIGWQWPVPEAVAALALFMTHLMLVDHRLPPAMAVAAVQQWMLDPDRAVPSLLPGAHRHTVTTTDLTRPALWAALAYHGC